MRDELQTSLFGYAERVMAVLPAEHASRSEAGDLRLLVNSGLDLNGRVDELERVAEFRRLRSATDDAFSRGDIKVANFGEFEIKNFFRRSGFYKDVYDGRPPDLNDVYERYVEAYRHEQVNIRYLAPIDAIDFSSNLLEFGDFKIRRFSRAELEEIFQNDLNRIFYPWAVADLDRLVDFWCIDVQESVPLIHPLDAPLGWDFSPSVRKEFSAFPPAVVDVLKRLVMFDWQTGWQDEPTTYHGQHQWEPGHGWLRFNVPCVLKISDNLLDSPHYPPAVPVIDTRPFFNGEGEEVGEQPDYAFEMSDEQAGEFVAFITDIGTVLDNVKKNQKKWAYLEVAVGFLVKAFFADGLQQLLWHITVLEALLGEDKKDLTELLSNRLAKVLGATKDERQLLREGFRGLYSFRSNLVHGNHDILGAKVYVGHLREARTLARRTLLWFLDYSDYIQRQHEGNASNAGLPDRKDILSMLDMDEGRRSRVRWLIDTMPKGFPHPKRWDA